MTVPVPCPSCLKVRDVSPGEARSARITRCRSCAARGRPIGKRLPPMGPIRVCEVCQARYVGKTTKTTCSPRCTATLKRNDTYFGGRFFETVGRGERECQLCGKEIKANAALHPHHVYGRERTHDRLEALHAGCHQLVSTISLRHWTEREYERLIAYVVMQQEGVEATVTVTVKRD